jgi:peptide/nickel transport system permease protein
VATSAALLATAAGVLVGMVAGLLGGAVDAAAMRMVDIFLALPVLPLLVLVGALVGPNTPVLVLLIAAVSWPGIARLVRSRALSYRSRGSVAAARGFGGGPLYVMRRHLVPPLAPVIAAGFVTVAGRAVLMESGLAFLGLGDPTGVSWGLMLNRALMHPGLFFTPGWAWWVLPPGFAITVSAMGFTLLAVGLEPLFNPRWRRFG